MTTKAVQLYRGHETVASDAKELRDFIDEVNAIGVATGCDIYWRGQANHEWGVLSSLARLSDSATGIRDADLHAAEQGLLTDAKRWVTAPFVAPAYDLEWLALLQHHGVPTRLVDFTEDYFVATFMAVESLDDVDGRLFAVAIPPANVVSNALAPTFQIDTLPLGQLRIWRPQPAISPRLAAQRGMFALGKLPSTNPAQHRIDDETAAEKLMTRAEIVSVASIPLYFVSVTRGRRRRPSVVPSAFTARIHMDKSSLREQLARRARRGALRPPGNAVNHASCYPDVDGMRLYSKTVSGVQRGLG